MWSVSSPCFNPSVSVRGRVCVCACVCVHSCVCLCVYTHVYEHMWCTSVCLDVEARAQPLVSLLRTHWLCFLRYGLLLNLQITHSTRLASQRAPRIVLSLPPVGITDPSECRPSCLQPALYLPTEAFPQPRALVSVTGWPCLYCTAPEVCLLLLFF